MTATDLLSRAGVRVKTGWLTSTWSIILSPDQLAARRQHSQPKLAKIAFGILDNKQQFVP